jgi:hypothetical protein
VRCVGSAIGPYSDEKLKKTPNNPEGRHTNKGTLLVQARQCRWATILWEAKQKWSEDQIQEQAQLLAAYHPIRSMQVPDWVKMDVYVYMERYVYLNTGQ